MELGLDQECSLQGKVLVPATALTVELSEKNFAQLSVRVSVRVSVMRLAKMSELESVQEKGPLKDLVTVLQNFEGAN